MRQVGGGPPTGRGSPGRSASGEWLWARMLVKTPVFRTGSHEKGFGLVMLGPRHGCKLRFTAPSGTSAKARRWQVWMILLRVMNVVTFQCFEREERFCERNVGVPTFRPKPWGVHLVRSRRNSTNGRFLCLLDRVAVGSHRRAQDSPPSVCASVTRHLSLTPQTARNLRTRERQILLPRREAYIRLGSAASRATGTHKCQFSGEDDVNRSCIDSNLVRGAKYHSTNRAGF